MIWKTRITEMTKTKFPLIMAAFARWSTIEFAAAFSNAGGLGIITALNYDISTFKNELQKMYSLTNNPFGVNITIIPPRASHDEPVPKEEDYLKYVEIALNEGVNIFTSSAYQAPFIGKRVREAGCYWFHKCSLVRHALSAERLGANAITIIGLEASGFKNPFMHTTLVNLTIAKELLKVPIIAAGGFGDARGIIGALTMGAEAVCMGSAILTSKESPLHSVMKEEWLNIDVLTEEYHKALYHMTLKGTRVPSPAVAFQSEVKPLKVFIESLMEDADAILKSYGFTSEEFNTLHSR
jgi:NAD(P)H-dependent flavin oxidoreductase YrpB (nitropropane dioxygenase family)